MTFKKWENLKTTKCLKETGFWSHHSESYFFWRCISHWWEKIPACLKRNFFGQNAATYMVKGAPAQSIWNNDYPKCSFFKIFAAYSHSMHENRHVAWQFISLEKMSYEISGHEIINRMRSAHLNIIFIKSSIQNRSLVIMKLLFFHLPLAVPKYFIAFIAHL